VRELRKTAEGLCAGVSVRDASGEGTFQDVANDGSRASSTGSIRPREDQAERGSGRRPVRCSVQEHRTGSDPGVPSEHAESAMAELPEGLSSAAAVSMPAHFQVLSWPCTVGIIERTRCRRFLPVVRSVKVTAWLYPSEDSALLGCETCRSGTGCSTASCSRGYAPE